MQEYFFGGEVLPKARVLSFQWHALVSDASTAVCSNPLSAVSIEYGDAPVYRMH